MTIDYKIADWIRSTLKKEPEKKGFIMDEYGLNDRAIDRVIGFETYSKPIKKKTTGFVSGEKCGRSKLKERDIKCIRFLSVILEDREQARDNNVSLLCIKNIIKRLSWKHVK